MSEPAEQGKKDLQEDRLNIEANKALVIGPMGSTRMMCSPARMAQEDRFFQALSAAERYELSKGELLITYAGGTLRFVPMSPQAEGNAPE
jgi:hypothetical protein